MRALPPSHPVSKFKRLFEELEPERELPIDDVYDPAVHFEDPFRKIDGRNALTRYFEKLTADLTSCRFEFGPAVLDDGEAGGERSACVPWTMHLRLRRGPKSPIVVSGLSHLKFRDRITYQRDYADAGEMVYEHVPLLGAVIRRIKARF